MGLADGPGQPLLRLRHRDQMDVIGHQAVAPNLDAPFAAPLGYQLQLRGIVFVAEKRLLSAISPLRYVVRQARHDQSRKSRHARILLNLTQRVNIG
jgi:hypothetical protein